MNDLVKIPFNNFGKCQKSWKCVGKCKKQMNEENCWKSILGKLEGCMMSVCLLLVHICTFFTSVKIHTRYFNRIIFY